MECGLAYHRMSLREVEAEMYGKAAAAAAANPVSGALGPLAAFTTRCAWVATSSCC